VVAVEEVDLRLEKDHLEIATVSKAAGKEEAGTVIHKDTLELREVRK
jgi:hypothetical protein